MKKLVVSLGFIFILLICLKSIKAEECFPVYLCGEWGECADGLESRNCQDVKCEKKDIIERRFCDNLSCKPQIECSAWTECVYTDKTEDIFKGNIKFGGYRNRVCRDLTGCVDTFSEESSCEETFDLDLKEINECGKGYMVAIDPLSSKEVARISLDSWKNKRFDLTFTQGNSDFCPTCYNGIKDNNEEELDCGGDCNPCVEEKNLPIAPFMYSFWALSTLFLFLIIHELHTWKKLPRMPKSRRLSSRFT